MHLIDKYSTLSSKQSPRPAQIQPFNAYNFTNQIKKRLSQKYQQHLSIIESINQNDQPLICHENIIAIVFNKQPGEFYDLQLFVLFNIEAQIIQIRGHLCYHGIPVSLQSLNRITSCMNMALNLNKIITPIRICLNPKTGAIYLQGNVYTEMGRQNEEMAIEMVNKIVFLITLIEQNKEILLYLIQEKMKMSSSFLKMYPSLGNRLSEAQDLIASLQTSLFSMNLNIFDKNNSINYEVRRHQFFLQYQALSEDVQKTLSLYVSNQQVSTYKKLSKLSNQQYEDLQIQNCKDSVSRKIQSKILNRVYLIDREQWITWNCLSSGGYGKIEVADVKVYLPPSDTKFTESQSKTTKTSSEDLIEVRIIRKSDKRKIKDSRVVHQKEIIKNLKNKAHPNIATFLQVIPQRIKNLPSSEISNYLQNEKYLYLLFEVNTSLDSFMRKNLCFSLYHKVFTLQQAAKGLLFLHKQKIVHIDFKPANIFIGKHCLAKIGDFGESLQIGKIQQYTNATTFPYSPPQYNKHQPFLLTEKADVYSFGVTLFECLFQSNVKKPMQQRYSLRNNSGNSQIQLPYIQPQKIKQYGNKRVISILSFLCLRCINVQSQQRPSMAWIVTVLQYCRFYLQLLLSK